jgi:hypothetical protein
MTNTRLVLPIEDNLGYAAEQIETNVTLNELLEAIQEAIQEHGGEAVVVLDNGQRYGAQFGRIRPAFMNEEWFQPADQDSKSDYWE